MITAKINGVDHVFKLGVASCRKVEQKLGKSIFEALGIKEVGANGEGKAALPTFGDLSVLFWGALLFEKRDISQEEADELFDAFLDDPEHDLGSAIELIQGAINFTKASPQVPEAIPAQ